MVCNWGLSGHVEALLRSPTSSWQDGRANDKFSISEWQGKNHFRGQSAFSRGQCTCAPWPCIFPCSFHTSPLWLCPSFFILQLQCFYGKRRVEPWQILKCEESETESAGKFSWEAKPNPWLWATGPFAKWRPFAKQGNCWFPLVFWVFHCTGLAGSDENDLLFNYPNEEGVCFQKVISTLWRW